MLQQEHPADFIIATGITSSLRDFVEAAFDAVDLNISDHIMIDSSLLRPNDLKYSAMDPTRAVNALGWQSRFGLPEIIDRMMIDEP